MLAVANLSRIGLQPVSFSLGSGECIAVSGPSGAGKTLLLRALADLDLNAGTVTLDGQDRTAIPAPAWRRQIAYLPAEPGWWADRVGDHFVNWPGAEKNLNALNLPMEAADWPVARCSTGERLRLALIRLLEGSPRVLLLDEPTAALDSGMVGAVETLIAERRQAGAAILWVTHDDAQASRVATRRLIVTAGTVREATP